MSLVFGYDIDNPKSWKGRPTENYLVTTSWGQSNCMGRSDKRPFNATSHSSRDILYQGTGFNFTPGAATRIPEKPDNIQDCEIWYVRDSNPDNYSRFSPYNDFNIDELPALDTPYVVSSYVYIPPNVTLSTNTFQTLCQNNTGTDWHTGSNTATATYNSTYNYWSTQGITDFSNSVSSDLDLRGEWQRIYLPFTPSSTIRNQEIGSGIVINKLGGYMRPSLVGQSQQNYYFITASQLEPGTFPSPYVYGTRTNTQCLLDLAGNSTVTVNNLTYTNDNKFTFNNTNSSLISVAHNSTIQPVTEYSSEAWVWIDSSQDNQYPRIWDKINALVHISQTSPFTIAQNTTTSSLRQVAIGSAIQHSTWTHIVTTYDGQIGKIYLNGLLVVTNDFGTVENVSSTTSDLYIGSNLGGTRNFNGKIDMLKIYDHAMTPDEVSKKYNQTKSRFGL